MNMLLSPRIMKEAKFLIPFYHPSKAHILYLIPLLLIVFSVLASITNASDDNSSSLVDLVAEKSVVVEENVQQQSGIKTMTVAPATFQAEMVAYGKVLNIQPLLDIRILYFTALSEKSIADAALNLSDKNLSRLRNLHRKKAVSSRKLLEQTSQWQTDRAKLDAATNSLKGIRESAVLTWGVDLTDMVLTANSPLISDLINQRQSLLLISLVPGQKLPANTNSIAITGTGQRKQAVQAVLLAASPRIDSLSQGESYFFKTDNPAMKTDMRVTAWIAQSKQPMSGVFIPETALIRHLGQSYVYIQSDEERFSRRTVQHFIPSDQGLFIQHGIMPGEKIVTVGAQMLLSEEFRSQIPDEDDDD